SNIKRIKLSTSMFDDEKIKLIEKLPEADTILIIWIKLLSQAGRTNANGYIYLNENVPYTEEMLATIFDRSLNTVRLALKTLREFGMIFIDDDSFIRISNWEKHQNVEGMDRVRKLNAERNKRYRERKKQQQLLESKTNDVSVTSRGGTEEEIERNKEKDKEIKQKQRYQERKKQQQLLENKTNDVSVTSRDGTEEELERDKEKDIEIEQEQDKDVAKIIQFWDKNGFGVNNIHAKKQLLLWLDDSS